MTAHQFWTPTIIPPELCSTDAEHRVPEQEFRESEKLLHSLVDTLPVMIWMSGVDKLCTYFNQSKLRFAGRSLDSVLGNGWTEGVHPEDLGRIWDIYSKAFDLREPFEMEFRFRRHDGEYRWLLSSALPRFNSNGSFVGYIGSVTDITERKVAEGSLSKFSKDSIEAQEEERVKIAGELHHHIDSLVLLSINLDRYEQNLPDSATDVHQEIGEIRKQVKDIVSGILDLSHRLHSSKLEYLGLAAAARSFCEELAATQNVKIDFHSEGVPNELPEKIALCLYRVLQEALQNAIKHSGSRRCEVSVSGKSNEIQLTVRDWGDGFDPSVAIKGPGFGLVGLKERLKLVDGKLLIESEPQRGSTIQASVPLKTESTR